VSMCKGDGGAAETVSQGVLWHRRLVSTLRCGGSSAAQHGASTRAALATKQFGACGGQTRQDFGKPFGRRCASSHGRALALNPNLLIAYAQVAIKGRHTAHILSHVNHQDSHGGDVIHRYVSPCMPLLDDTYTVLRPRVYGHSAQHLPMC